MKNIRKFETTAEIESAVLTEPYVLYNEETDMVYTNHNGGSSDNEVDYSKEYLTFEALEDGDFKFKNHGKNGTMHYASLHNDNWLKIYDDETIHVSRGDKIAWKSTITPSDNPDSGIGIGSFDSTCEFNVYGNIMSLVYGDDFAGKVDLSDKPYAFANLFFNYDSQVPCKVKDCHNLVLPATTLSENCYYMMFYLCDTLATPPQLLATTLVNSCYGYMFSECTNLSEITMLATDISAEDCLSGWVYNVSSTGTFVKHPNMTSLPTGTSGIPEGWTVKDAVL